MRIYFHQLRLHLKSKKHLTPNSENISMARSSSNSMLNSLRGIIWISTSVLSFFICTFGLISYLVVTLITNNPFFGVFIPFVFLAFIVIAFGWWLSNEVIRPIEKVTLLARSLERNSSTSLPKTSGSSETDQLLQTLHRNSQQTQNIVTLMDKVANGNLNVTLTPLKGSDRLTASFQKLLSKVSESIHAKEELTKLENSIEDVNRGISSVRNGNLAIDVQSDHIQTKEITETFNYLIEKITVLISLIKVDALQTENSAADIKKTIEALVQQDENKIQQMNNASITLKQVPNLIEKIADELINSAKSAKQTIDKTHYGTKIANENSESVSQLRIKVREASNRIQSLNERSHEIAKVAKTVDDLANRTNMIALNASIQATEFGEEGRSFVLVSEELERLAARANGTNKQISLLNNSILSEIGKVEEALDTTMGEIAGLSKFAIENGNVLNELERYVGQFLNLQENLIEFSKDKSEETDKAFETFVSSISESENSVSQLKISSEQIKRIYLMMQNLQSHTTEFRVTPQQDPQAELPEDESLETSSQDAEMEKNSSDETSDQEFDTEAFNSAKLNSDEFEAMKFDSTELDSRDLDSDEFNSEELRMEDLDSDAFDSKEFGYDEFMSDEIEANELKEPEATPEKPNPELFNDDLEIEEQNLSEPSDSTVSIPFDEDDLLNLTDNSAQDPNTNLSA